MGITRRDIEQETETLINDKTYKGHLTLGIITLIIGGVISSPLFIIVRAIFEFILLFGGLFLIGWAVYQYVRTQEKR